ncbi:MAG: RNA polymerase sigma factor [Actinomycetota bacterium]|nr:RNA polymerase sigma factor [Acidimicrobiia bacterium]MDQ3469998.1 RNA polymerase sigma factor [Actinomycetota bacterium]
MTDAVSELRLPIALQTRSVRHRAGDDDVASAVYRDLAPAVLGYLRSQRVADPEDVLGEVFLHVARNLPRFRGDADALRRWVFTIAHHRIVDSWRRRRTRPVVVSDDVPERADDSGSVEIFDPALQQALDGLSTQQRAVVLLRFVADLSLHDVARVTRRRVGAVKSLQHRGLCALQQALRADE